MKDKIKVLFVEDEHTLAEIIRDTLNDKGFDIIIANNGEVALEMFKDVNPDVIVTDIMMPKMDGFSFVGKVRKNGSKIPVMFLSSRSSVEDVVSGFELGGNDYLRKPFAISELIVRIKSLTGRINDSKEREQSIFHIGSFIFDSNHWILSHGVDTERLSGRESELLFMLCRKKGDVVQNKELLMTIWGDDSYYNTRSLNVFITNLRHKLEADPAVKIISIRGVGYKLTDD